MHADCTLWILFLRPGFTRVANLPKKIVCVELMKAYPAPTSPPAAEGNALPADVFRRAAERYLGAIGLHTDVYDALCADLTPGQDVREYVVGLDEATVTKLVSAQKFHQALSRRVWYMQSTLSPDQRIYPHRSPYPP